MPLNWSEESSAESEISYDLASTSVTNCLKSSDDVDFEICDCVNSRLDCKISRARFDNCTCKIFYLELSTESFLEGFIRASSWSNFLDDSVTLLIDLAFDEQHPQASCWIRS